MDRLLVTGGTFMVISLGAPTGRLDIFSKAGLNWDVEVVLMPKPILYLKSESSLTGMKKEGFSTVFCTQFL